MQCSQCGTQLPVGAAHCPNCGSITPYQISSSGVSPSNPTMNSPSSQISPYSTIRSNPYETPNSYETPNPYDPPNPYQTPTPPPPPRRRPSPISIALLIVLALLIIGTGGFFYYRSASSNQTHTSGSLTPQARQTAVISSSITPTQQVTALPTTTPTSQAAKTPSPKTPQDLYTQVIQTPPALDDPLRMNGTNNWDEHNSADGSCAFNESAYHASEPQQNQYSQCMAQAPNFSDLAYQVQMTIIKGEFGGIVFRTDSSHSKYYSFFIDRTGTYTLMTSVDSTGNNDRVLQKGTSAAIKTSLNQANLLTVIARGSSIYVYINQQYITSANDGTYHAGQIGVFGGDYTQAPADVAFSHLQVWKL